MDYGSPNKNLNKGYKSESVKAERSKAKDASGGRSWMSKHSQSGGSPVKKHHGAPMEMKGDLDKDGKMSGYEAKRQAAIEKNMKK